MTIKSILIVLAMVAFFTFAVVWIAKNGGWDSEKGCHGDCNACRSRCEEQEALKRLRAQRAQQAKAAQPPREEGPGGQAS